MKNISRYLSRYLVGILLVLSFVFSGSGIVGAYSPLVRCESGKSTPESGQCVDCNSGTVQDSPICKTGNTNPVYGTDSVLTKITNVIAVVSGVVAVFVIVIAGGQFVFSGGDSQKVQNARNAILYAVIGLVVIIVARSIVLFVVSKIG